MSSSLRRWELIEDGENRREIVVDVDNTRICAEQVPRAPVESWPAFTQLALRTDALSTVDGLRRITREFDRRFVPTPPADQAPHPLWLATHRDLILLGEPGVEHDERFITDASSERLTELLAAEAVHFGYDPAGLTLHLTRLRAGYPDFAWCDSRRPGPSYALNFEPNGRCTRHDPRQFALARLGLGEDAEQFDRTAFLQTELAKFGVGLIDPGLQTVDRITCFDVA